VRRPFLILLVAILGSSFLFATHYYIARRLALDTELPEPWRGLVVAAIALCGACLVLQPVAERALRPPLSRVVSWPASLWMGIGFFLLNLLLVSDALLWLAGTPARAAGEVAAHAETAGVRAAVVCLIAFTAGAFGLRSAFRPPRLVRLRVAIERWPAALDGFRIVQLSDMHIGPILGRRFAEEIVARANALEPDLIAVTGDVVDGSVKLLVDEVAPFAALRGRHGVFFVTGNHDHFSGAGAWSARMRELGMRVLRNERVEIGGGDACFDLVGVDDHHAHFIGEGAEDLDAALAGRDPERAAVLLAHDPATFKRARHTAIDLQLSGHTHGGQIWPFRWFIRLVVPWVEGHHRHGRAQLYVSRGTGFWGPPMRLRAPAEITEIRIYSTSEPVSDST
jgi:predicted MPP superfamily phosphohydrolase